MTAKEKNAQKSRLRLENEKREAPSAERTRKKCPRSHERQQKVKGHAQSGQKRRSTPGWQSKWRKIDKISQADRKDFGARSVPTGGTRQDERSIPKKPRQQFHDPEGRLKKTSAGKTEEKRKDESWHLERHNNLHRHYIRRAQSKEGGKKNGTQALTSGITQHTGRQVTARKKNL